LGISNLESQLQTRRENEIELVRFTYRSVPRRLLTTNRYDAISNFNSIIRQKWRHSSARQFLHSTLSLDAIPPVTRLLAFGLGRFLDRDAPEPLNHISTVQHELLVDIRDTLRQSQGCGIRDPLAQDPAYLRTERALLEMKGIQSTTHPINGFLEADNQSFIVSIDPDVPVKEIILDVCRPAAILWLTSPNRENQYVNRPKAPSEPTTPDS
jgi:hypothetical protein